MFDLKESIRTRFKNGAARIWSAAGLASALAVGLYFHATLRGAGQNEGLQPDFIERQFGLKPGEGRELVLTHCIPCHSTSIVVANHLDRQGWNRIIDQMQSQNGMNPVEPEIRGQILDYLEKAQRPEDASLSVGKQSPWAAPLYQPNPLWE